ncbi:hypothetical protein NC652_006380 [Populus alba x Populus x berolinensis]|nr:hypothetical protein NC652_006380 [Populus alba x Populus x berolinensis]
MGTSLILLRSWCEIGLVFLREAFPTITLNSSTVNFFPNCSSLLSQMVQLRAKRNKSSRLKQKPSDNSKLLTPCFLASTRSLSIIDTQTHLNFPSPLTFAGANPSLPSHRTLRTFYSPPLRSDHLCWGLCFFVFFCSFDLLPSQKSPPRSNPSLGSHCFSPALRSLPSLHNLPNNNLHPQVLPIVLFMFTRT